MAHKRESVFTVAADWKIDKCFDYLLDITAGDIKEQATQTQISQTDIVSVNRAYTCDSQTQTSLSDTYTQTLPPKKRCYTFAFNEVF